ncbi:hypothetical protein BDN71DRAFT_1218784 [Pleurotus eryngii]|uniref:Uncharacterized protein n=1 Tax=Pleurotus eryngii TaxID=5323 RepID=A0A9P5ZRH3_PLEER|nr:hypothetical protein BDN71DRAFT_1218784 [Pleurotus eryngii]
MKATMPMTATPPATDNPIIEPVPSPPPSSPFEPSLVGDGDAEEEVGVLLAGSVTVTSTTEPAKSVDETTVSTEDGGGGVEVGGACVVVGVVTGGVDVGVLTGIVVVVVSGVVVVVVGGETTGGAEVVGGVAGVVGGVVVGGVDTAGLAGDAAPPPTPPAPPPAPPPPAPGMMDCRGKNVARGARVSVADTSIAVATAGGSSPFEDARTRKVRKMSGFMKPPVPMKQVLRNGEERCWLSLSRSEEEGRRSSSEKSVRTTLMGFQWRCYYTRR